LSANEAAKLVLESETFMDLKAGDMVLFWSHLLYGTADLSADEKAAWGLLLTYRSWWCKP